MLGLVRKVAFFIPGNTFRYLEKMSVFSLFLFGWIVSDLKLPFVTALLAQVRFAPFESNKITRHSAMHS